MAQLPKYRHAGCLQLSHRRPSKMCGLRNRPRTDVNPPRFWPPSNCHGWGHIVSPPRGDTFLSEAFARWLYLVAENNGTGTWRFAATETKIKEITMQVHVVQGSPLNEDVSPSVTVLPSNSQPTRNTSDLDDGYRSSQCNIATQLRELTCHTKSQC